MSIELNIKELKWFGDIVQKAKEKFATDIDILEGKPVRLGLLKSYTPIEPIIVPSREQLDELVSMTLPAMPIVSGMQKETVGRRMVNFQSETSMYSRLRSGGVEYCFSIQDFGRFRVSCTKSEEGLGLSIRKLPYYIPAFDDMNAFGYLKGIKEFLNFHTRVPGGLILHAGITGSGKTTLISSEVDFIATKIDGKILTYENPIEYKYTFRKASIRQYEVGRHVDSYVSALRMALRNDPSVIVLGEVRTKDEVQAMIDTAVRGHLLFSTLHTSNVMNTLRFLDGMGEGGVVGESSSWRQMLAYSIQAIVSQKLIYREGYGFVIVPEVLIPDNVVRQKIAEGQYLEIQNMLAQNTLRGNGTITFAEVTQDLFSKKICTLRETAELNR